MLKLTEKRFADYFRQQGETGMGYWVATAHMKDGRAIAQVVIQGGAITCVRNHEEVPFAENEIDHFEVTHDKWDWR